MSAILVASLWWPCTLGSRVKTTQKTHFRHAATGPTPILASRRTTCAGDSPRTGPRAPHGSSEHSVRIEYLI